MPTGYKWPSSNIGFDDSLRLWSMPLTDISIDSVYDVKVNPLATPDNVNPIHFNLLPQQLGALSDVEIHCTFRVLHHDNAATAVQDDVSIINNIAGGLWNYVEVYVGDSGNIMQSMNLSYAFQTYFEKIFNHSSNRVDHLQTSEKFIMDVGTNKANAEVIHVHHGANDLTTNTGNIARHNEIIQSRVVTTVSKLACPLFTHHKVLPTKCHIRIVLNRNRNAFVLTCVENGNYKLQIQDVFLKCRYVKPSNDALDALEVGISRNPAIYEVEYPEVIFRSVNTGTRYITLTNIFTQKLPKIAFFALQKTSCLAGEYQSNPFVFGAFEKFQIYINNEQYFTDPLTNANQRGMLMQLYKAIGYEYQGECLLNSKNFDINQVVAIPLGANKEFKSSLTLNRHADIRVEMDLGYLAEHPHNVIIYSLYDKVFEIDVARNLVLKS